MLKQNTNKIILAFLLIFAFIIGYIFYLNSSEPNKLKEIEVKKVFVLSTFEKPKDKDGSGVILNEIVITPTGKQTIPIKESSEREYTVVISKSQENITTELQIKQNGKIYTIVPKTKVYDLPNRNDSASENKLFRPTINLAPYVGLQVSNFEPTYGIGIHTNLLKTENFSYIELGISYNLNGDIGTGLTISVEL